MHYLLGSISGLSMLAMKAEVGGERFEDMYIIVRGRRLRGSALLSVVPTSIAIITTNLRFVCPSKARLTELCKCVEVHRFAVSGWYRERCDRLSYWRMGIIMALQLEAVFCLTPASGIRTRIGMT
jgi:hypothetical protein